MTPKREILVIGAGIVGASIAWHLASAGAKVTVVESAEPGGVATSSSFAWINAGWGNPESYFRLRVRAMTEWRRLVAIVPGLPLIWSGALFWDASRERLEGYARQRSERGGDVRCIDRAEAARVEPALTEPPDFALHVAADGVVEPRAAAMALLTDAVRRGARLRTGLAVTALAHDGVRVFGIETADGRVDADEIVVAAGAATAGSPQRSERACRCRLPLPFWCSRGRMRGY